MVHTWIILYWKDRLNRDELLAIKFWLLERRPKDINVAIKRLNKVRMKNKERFYYKH